MSGGNVYVRMSSTKTTASFAQNLTNYAKVYFYY